MQYLYSKKNSLQNIFMSYKVGQVILEPYEYVKVDIEKWDTKALETVRNMPTFIGLAEKVPAKYVELRKTYLEAVDSGKDNTGKIESLENDIHILETTLSAEKEDIKKQEEALQILKEECEKAQKSLEENPDDVEAKANVSVANKNLEQFEEALGIQKDEYSKAVELLKNKKAELKALKK